MSRRLTACGLEVETVEQVGHDISGVVVAEVLDIEELTGFNKPIRYCQVSTGDGQERHVICGASNFAVGDRVALAQPGAVLPGGFEIGARKTYGHVSEGMICSAAELAIGEDHSGIMVLRADAPLGTDFVSYAGLRDVVFDINVTPDKGFALSVRGVARELAISYRVPFTDPADVGLPAERRGACLRTSYPASIEDTTACDRFVLREVRGLDPAAPTPLAMKIRLARAGQRSVSLAVDVTNYLMLELGQPLHAFDRARLTGPIVVRRAEPGEKLETLDHVVRTLDPEDILITDSSGPISLAGTMGGAGHRGIGRLTRPGDRGRALLRPRHRPDEPAAQARRPRRPPGSSAASTPSCRCAPGAGRHHARGARRRHCRARLLDGGCRDRAGDDRDGRRLPGLRSPAWCTGWTPCWPGSARSAAPLPSRRIRGRVRKPGTSITGMTGLAPRCW